MYVLATNESAGPVRDSKSYEPPRMDREAALDVPVDEVSEPDDEHGALMSWESGNLITTHYQDGMDLGPAQRLVKPSADRSTLSHSWAGSKRETASTTMPENEKLDSSHELKSSYKDNNDLSEDKAIPDQDQDIEEQIRMDPLGYPMEEGPTMSPSEQDDDALEDSPYPEVRASVSNIDDPSMPVLSFRVILLSIFFSALVSGVNTFLMVRAPAPLLSATFVIVAVYPLGNLLAVVLPTKEYSLPSWLGGGTMSLNPGPFNIKEHAVITAAASIAVSPTYVLHFFDGQRRFLQ